MRMRYYHERRLGLSGQTVEWTAPEGIPDGDGEITITTSAGAGAAGETWPADATLGTGASTTAADAAEAATAIEVETGDGTLFARGTYTVVTPEGRRMEVVVEAIDADTLYLATPLRFAVPEDSVIASATLSYELPDDLVATAQRLLQIRWSYEVGGVECVHTECLSICREPFVVTLTEADLELHDLGITEYLDRGGNWRGLIDGATQDLRLRLSAKRLKPDLIRERAGLLTVLTYTVLAKYYATVPSQLERAKLWRDAAAHALDDVAATESWYDANEDGVHTAAEMQRSSAYARIT